MRRHGGFKSPYRYQFMNITLEEIEAILEQDFKNVRTQVQKAVDASPNRVTYEDALKQVKMVGSNSGNFMTL